MAIYVTITAAEVRREPTQQGVLPCLKLKERVGGEATICTVMDGPYRSSTGLLCCELLAIPAADAGGTVLNVHRTTTSPK